ncbi:amino acid adenylation domain-containing protein [Streptomyces sp. NPDC005876]|uniref:amino acid adenylation domain-containing protein n=1 Tax=Streptomyces sp. NPDC005876 TaxID=3157076 RepID=UPI0034008943
MSLNSETLAVAVMDEARRHPERIALHDASDSWTYGDLRAVSAAVARALRAFGLRDEDAVAVVGGRSARTVLGLIGVLHAGGAYCVIDPALPTARKRMMFEDLTPKAVLLTDPNISEVQGIPSDLPMLRLEDVATEGQYAEPFPAAASNLAYVMYTSGSTGRPKGVQIEHGAVLNMLRGYESLAPTREHNTGTLIAGTSFDVSVWEIFGTLGTGGTLYVPSDDHLADPEQLWHAICQAGVTSAYIPPALLPGVVEAAQRTSSPTQAKSVLDRVLVGVEPLPQELLGQLADAVPGLRVVNGYGPTETTVVATLHLFDKELVDAPWRRTPIGRALPGTEVHLLDPDLALVEPGHVGEIVVSGAGVARGYVGAPELTQSSFIVNPVNGRRAYRTGDYARQLACGALEYTGRQDNQVKIGGFRVETGDVEAALAAHPGVRRAVVFTEESPAGRRLWGAAERSPGSSGPETDSAELRRWMEERLPAFMVPHRLLSLDALPLTANGKVDHPALIAMASQRPAELGDKTDPATPREQLLVDMWREVLDLPWLGVTDDFQQCGGSSLAAIRIVARLRAEGLAVSVAGILSTRTVRALAERCLEQPTQPGREDVRDVFPVAVSQQGLWAWRELNPHCSDTTVLHAVRLDGPLDMARLREALQSVTNRHPALRTVFRTDEAGRLHQHVRATTDAPWSVRKVEASADVDARLEQLRARRLDVTEHAWDAELLCAPDFSVLVVIADHMIFDGWSAEIFDAELVRAYDDAQSARALPGGTAPGPAAVAQRDWLASPESRPAREFWAAEMGAFTGRMALPEPLTRTEPHQRRTTGSTLVVPTEVASALRKLASQEGTTFFTAVLAAFKAFLHRRGLGPENTVSVAHSSRDAVSAHDTLGYFVNLVPFTDPVDDTLRFSEYLSALAVRSRQVLNHAALPFEEMVKDLPAVRGTGVAAPARIVLAQEIRAQRPRTAGDLVFSQWQDVPLNAIYDLAVFVDERDGLRLRWVCDDSSFLEGERQRLMTGFEEFLTALAAAPDTEIRMLSAVGAVEGRLLDAAARPVPGTSSDDTTVLELFDRQLAERPTAPAVRHPGGTVSYAELARRADAIAAEIGGRADQSRPVVVVLDKSPDLIAALIAAARVGSCYLPLAPDYAHTRLAQLAERSNAAVVVSRSELLNGIHLPTSVRTVLLDRPAVPSDLPAAATVGPDDLLYVMPTSGTSGIPKLVGVPHRGVVRMVHGSSTLPMGPDDRTMLVVNSSFDVAAMEVWGPLVNGGSIVVPDPADLADPDRLCVAVAREGVTVGFFPVTLFARMLEASPGHLAGLRHLLVGGEAVPPELFAEAERHVPRGILMNGYGPTENTTYSCCYRLDRDPSVLRSIPIGPSISGSTAQVMDDRLRPLPVGAVGEIMVGGSGLAVGYLNDPELTAARFLNHPGQPGKRLYRTGDMGRLLPDGAIEYLGRADGQVKIRGFRVELGEVEHALMAHPDVRRAVALAADDPAGGRRLLAGVEWGSSRATTNSEELRNWMQARLPGYLVPARIVVLDTLPLTPNGKVDHAAVITAAQMADQPDSAVTRPLTELQRIVAEEWELVLDRRGIGLDDDFFALGGDSMAVLTVASRLSRRLGQTVRSRMMFECSTVRSLAERLGATKQAPQGRTASTSAQDALRRRVERVRALAGGANSQGPR